MKSDVLLLCDGTSFMVNAIIDNLKSGGYDVTCVEPKVDSININKNRFSIIVFYLGEFVNDISETLVYLKDLCVEEDKYLFCIGSREELKILKRDIPEHVLAGAFERPVNVKNLLEALDELMAQFAKENVKKSVLVVDDDVVFLNMMKDWLSNAYRVSLVNSGTRAITFLANNKPDLILLDYEMPVTSGPHVLEMLREDSELEDIPVIFLTGRGDRESVTRVLALKPDGYLLKSLGKKELLAALEDFFEKQREEELSKKIKHFN